MFLLPSNPIASDLVSLSPMPPLQHSSSLRGRRPGGDKTSGTPENSISRGEQKKEGSGENGDDSRLSSREETKHAKQLASVVSEEDEEKVKEIKMLEESEREEEEGCGMMEARESREQDEQKSERSADHKKANGVKNDSDRGQANRTSSFCFSASGKEGGVKEEEEKEGDVVSPSSFSDRQVKTLVESARTKQRRKEAYEFVDCLVSSIGAALGPNCSVQVLLPPCCSSPPPFSLLPSRCCEARS